MMFDATQTRRKAFCVNYRNIQTWNVGALFELKWSWPTSDIRPLATILKRRSEGALVKLAPDAVVHLLTIRFDGTTEPRDPTPISDVKGKLFRVHAGDVIFSKIDVRNGAIGLAPDGIANMCATSEFPIYSVDTRAAHPEYVRLLFRTTVFKNLLNSMISGSSGRKRIQPSQIESVRVPIPPRDVQDKIVTFWEKAQTGLVAAETAFQSLVQDLDAHLSSKTAGFGQATRSKVFLANYKRMQQWDVKAGRAAAFSAANPSFIRLGDYTEECTEMVKAWTKSEKEWPVYGVNNRYGVFFNGHQLGNDFNASYKKIEKDWFFHNPTRANVGSLGIVPGVPEDAITSPEYQVWRLKEGFLPDFMALMLRTDYFLALVAFNRVGGVKQRMYYANLAEIRLPMISEAEQRDFAERRRNTILSIEKARRLLDDTGKEVERMIIGTAAVEPT